MDPQGQLLHPLLPFPPLQPPHSTLRLSSPMASLNNILNPEDVSERPRRYPDCLSSLFSTSFVDPPALLSFISLIQDGNLLPLSPEAFRPPSQKMTKRLLSTSTTLRRKHTPMIHILIAQMLCPASQTALAGHSILSL